MTAPSDRSRTFAQSSRLHRELKKWRAQPAALVALAFLLCLVLIAIFGDIIMPHDPNHQDLGASYQPPGSDYLLGTDQFGRDILSRLIDATKVTVTAPLTAVSVAALLGIPTGLIAGYFRGMSDWILSRVADTLLSIPSIAMAIAIVAVLGPDLQNAMVAIGFVFAPRLFRIVRGAVLSVREELFVDSAVSIGASSSRILFTHILPNIASPLLVQVTLMLGFSVLAEASLSFLGLAVQPPAASWGSMLRVAYENQYTAPFQVIPPGVAMTLTILSFNTLGDGVRDIVAGRRTR